MRLSSSLTSANHSACGPFQCFFIGKFEHILTPCVHSLFSISLSLNDSHKHKQHYFLVLSMFSSLLFLLFCSIFVSVKLGLVKAQATYFWDKQSHSESLQVSRDSCQVCGIFSFPFLWVRKKGCKLASWGMLLCWLQETDALQEFWKQIRLTLFFGPWLLFSPTSRQQSNPPAFLLSLAEIALFSPTKHMNIILSEHHFKGDAYFIRCSKITFLHQIYSESCLIPEHNFQFHLA